MGIAMSGIRSSNPSIPAVTGIETPLARPHYRDWSQAGISHAASRSAAWVRRALNLVLALLAVIILTGYLGGAVATHVRIGDPLFSHILVPTYVAALLWGGLCLRDRRFRALIRES